MGFDAQIREFIQGHFAEAIIKEDDFREEQTFYVKPEAVLEICQALYEEGQLDVRFLADITCVDWLGLPEEKEGRFEVIYNLYSLKNTHRFFLKTRVPADKPELQSLTAIWRGADWMEREVFDLFGVVFTGHPDLTKILTPDDLKGHPLRKDFPLTYEAPQFSWNKDDPPRVIK